MMTSLWIALAIASLGAYTLKLAGMSLPTFVLEHPRVQKVASLLPVGMLAALVTVELFDDGGRYGWDWRVLVGVAAGAAAVRLRQGVLVVLLTAVGVTAALRAFV
ncbi:MAG: AzlD domain-containing protein [Nitriliruptoraceae bacterium]